MPRAIPKSMLKRSLETPSIFADLSTSLKFEINSTDTPADERTASPCLRAIAAEPLICESFVSISSALSKSSGLSTCDILRESLATISAGVRTPVLLPNCTPIPSAKTCSIVEAMRSRSAAAWALSTTASVINPSAVALLDTAAISPFFSSRMLLIRNNFALSERLNSDRVSTKTPTCPTTTRPPVIPSASRPSRAIAIISPSAEGSDAPIISAPSCVN